MIHIYTDGTGGPKVTRPDRPPRSGWGFVVIKDGEILYEACGPILPQVTTNAAELEAMIRALSYVHHGPPQVDRVNIWTDSKYVSDTVASITSLADYDFCLRNGKPISNADRIRLIYDFLYPLGEHSNVLVRWVAGHSDIPGNERADVLAGEAAYKGAEKSGAPP